MAQLNGGRRVDELRSDALQNRQALLAAAEIVFRKYGIDGPFNKVAKYAGVGRATLYRHFPDRLALVGAIYQERLRKYELFVSSNPENPALLRQLMALVATDQQQLPGLFRVLEPHLREPAITQMWNRTQQIFSRALKVSQDAGTVPDFLDDEDILVLVAMQLGAYAGPSARRDLEGTSLRVNRLMDLILSPQNEAKTE